MLVKLPRSVGTAFLEHIGPHYSYDVPKQFPAILEHSIFSKYYCRVTSLIDMKVSNIDDISSDHLNTAYLIGFLHSILHIS